MCRLLRLALVLVACSVAFTLSAAAQQKKRVAVFDFDYATVRDSAAAIFGNNVDVGKGISDLIVQELVRSGEYSVIERKALEQVLQEQNFSNSDRADATTAAQLGKILGVDAIIIGSITQFGTDDRATNVGGGMLGGRLGGFGLGGVSRRESKAVVGLSARLVNTDTAEILTVASGKGESRRSGTSLLGAGGASPAVGGAGLDMTSSNFAQTILGEAVNEAVVSLSKELNDNSEQVVARAIEIDGLVADVDGQTLTLNIGSSAGVKMGDRLQVKRAGREIRDPATGRVIRRVEDLLGELVITEVDSSYSVGTFTGSTPPQAGDRVASGQ